jgi:hypothetical protein
MLRIFRITHLYLGVFIAPALLFFAFTGFLQTAELHEAHPGKAAPARWIVTLAQIHKKQTATLPQRRPLETSNSPAAGAAHDGSVPVDPTRQDSAHQDSAHQDSTPHGPGDQQHPHHAGHANDATPPAAASGASPGSGTRPKPHFGLKLFFLLVSLGLAISTLTGIYMAYKYRRTPVLTTVLLVAGIVIPLLLLRF